MTLITCKSAQDIQTLQTIWETITETSCPYEYNFHLHTTCSDGQLPPEVLIEQALTIGLKGLAITDHHSVRGFQRVQQWLAEYQQKFSHLSIPQLWTGIEITSQLDETEVHILGYGFNPDHLCLTPYIQGKRPQGRDYLADRVIESIHKAGGLAVLAHPARYRRPVKELIPLAVQSGIDGIEVYYAYDNPKPWRSSPNETQQVKDITTRYPLYRTCGTDTHGLSLIQRL